MRRFRSLLQALPNVSALIVVEVLSGAACGAGPSAYSTPASHVPVAPGATSTDTDASTEPGVTDAAGADAAVVGSARDAGPMQGRRPRVLDGTVEDKCVTDSDCHIYAPPTVGCPRDTPCEFVVASQASIARYEALEEERQKKCKNEKYASSHMSCGRLGTYDCHCSAPPPLVITCDNGTCRHREK